MKTGRERGATELFVCDIRDETHAALRQGLALKVLQGRLFDEYVVHWDSGRGEN